MKIPRRGIGVEDRERKLADLYFSYKYSGIGGIFYIHKFPRAKWVELAITCQATVILITCLSGYRIKSESFSAAASIFLLIFLISFLLLGLYIKLDSKGMETYFLKYRSDFPEVD